MFTTLYPLRIGSFVAAVMILSRAIKFENLWILLRFNSGPLYSLWTAVNSMPFTRTKSIPIIIQSNLDYGCSMTLWDLTRLPSSTLISKLYLLPRNSNLKRCVCFSDIFACKLGIQVTYMPSSSLQTKVAWFFLVFLTWSFSRCYSRLFTADVLTGQKETLKYLICFEILNHNTLIQAKYLQGTSVCWQKTYLIRFFNRNIYIQNINHLNLKHLAMFEGLSIHVVI